MQYQQIIADIDSVSAELARVRNDLAQMPTPAQVRQNFGPESSVAAQFAAALDRATHTASNAATMLDAKLESLDANVRKALTALQGSDLDASQDAAAILGVIGDGGVRATGAGGSVGTGAGSTVRAVGSGAKVRGV